MGAVTDLAAGDALADDEIELRVPTDAVRGRTGPPLYLLGIYLRGTATEIGRISLRLDPDDPALVDYAGHIAFEVAPAHRGRRYALKATRLLAALARRHDRSELWLTTTPENLASRRTIELLGAQYVDTVPIPAHSDMRKLGIERVRRYRWTL